MQPGGIRGRGHHAVVSKLLLTHGHVRCYCVMQAGKTAADMATDNNGGSTLVPEYFRHGDFKMPFDWREYCRTQFTEVPSPTGGMIQTDYSSWRPCPGQEFITPEWARIGLSIVSSQDAAASR